MDTQEFIFALSASVMACGAGAWWCLRRLTQLRYLQDTPTSKIRSAAQGYVELYGVLRAHSAEPLRAPLTATPCLWWRFKIEEHQSDGKHSRWRIIDSGCSDAWLCLADATGECLIDPQGAEVRPATRQVWQGNQRHPLQARGGGLLSSLLSAGQGYRYTEERLHEGEPLYAIGDFHSTGGVQAAASAEAMQGAVVREWKRDFAGLLQRFDSDGSGALDEREWNLVRLAAGLEAEQRQQQAGREPVRHQLRQPAEAQPFILSSHAEDDLVRSFRWQALGAALLCLGGALLATWLLNQQL